MVTDGTRRDKPLLLLSSSFLLPHPLWWGQEKELIKETVGQGKS